MSHAETLEVIRFALERALLTKEQVEAAISEMRHAGVIFFDGTSFGRLIGLQSSMLDQYKDLIRERSQITDLAFEPEKRSLF